MLNKEEKAQLLEQHSKAKLNYFVQIKQFCIIDTAITNWSKSKDPKRFEHIASLQDKRKKYENAEQQYRRSIMMLEEKLKKHHIKFSPLIQNEKK